MGGEADGLVGERLSGSDGAFADDDELQFWRVGANILQLGREGTEPGWLIRRTETAVFLDESTCRRTVECHLRLDVFAKSSRWPRVADQLYLPLARIPRETGAHRTFAVIDESGAAVPRLAKGEERRLVLVGVLRSAEEILGRKPGHETAAAIGTIVYGQEAPASFARNCRSVDTPLVHDTEFTSILQEAYDVFYLIAAVAPGSMFGRRVLTYGYDDQFDLAFSKRTRRMALLWPRRQDAIAEFDAPAVADCRSYHFEVLAPPDVEVPPRHGRLDIQKEFVDAQEQPIFDNDPSDRRAHFFYEGRGSIKRATIRAPLRLADTGLTMSMGLATVAAGTLTFTLLVLALLRGRQTFAASSTEAWVTLLLAAPAIVTAIVAIRSGHGLTSWMSRDARITTALPAFGHSFMAVVLAAGAPVGVIQAGWGLAAILAGVAFVRFANQARSWKHAGQELR